MSKATPESVQAVFSPDSILDEVAHLNSLLTDSYATTSALFQLLHDHNIPVGSPELIKAREKVEAEMQTLRTANAGLVEKVNELEAARTKAAANSLANMLSYEEVVERMNRLEEAGDTCQDTLLRADNDIREHLQVANYNLHGLLNTGERIAPPNPPQTIHQAGIDASAAVRTAIKFAVRIWREAKGQP